MLPKLTLSHLEVSSICFLHDLEGLLQVAVHIVAAIPFPSTQEDDS